MLKNEPNNRIAVSAVVEIYLMNQENDNDDHPFASKVISLGGFLEDKNAPNAQRMNMLVDLSCEQDLLWLMMKTIDWLKIGVY